MGKVNLRVVDANGHRPVIVADQHELASSVMTQAARTGGFANLFVLFGTRSVQASLVPSTDALNEAIAEDMGDAHQDVEIGMLVDTIMTTGPLAANVRVALPRQARGVISDGAEMMAC